MQGTENKVEGRNIGRLAHIHPACTERSCKLLKQWNTSELLVKRSQSLPPSVHTAIPATAWATWTSLTQQGSCRTHLQHYGPIGSDWLVRRVSWLSHILSIMSEPRIQRGSSSRIWRGGLEPVHKCPQMPHRQVQILFIKREESVHHSFFE